jgi:hypothetical protein
MSTKTTIKRIALVAAVAAAFGGLSTVAANASDAAMNTADITSISLAQVTASPKVGAPVEINAGAVTAVEIPASGTVSGKFTGYLSSYPSGGFAQVAASTTLGDGATTAGTFTNVTASVSGSSINEISTSNATTGGAFGNTIKASNAAGVSTSGFGSFAFTPSVAGTYVLTVWNDANKTGTVDIGEAVQTITLTVSAATTLSAQSAIVRQAPVGTAVTATTETSDADYSASLDGKTYSATKGTPLHPTQVSQVEVILLNADGTAAGQGNTINASVTGVGLVSINNSGGPADGSARTASYITTGTTNTAVVHIDTDGTAGTGSVTISVTDAVTGATTVIATKVYVSTGQVASLSVAATNYTIGKAGTTTGAAVTARGAGEAISPVAAGTTIPAFVIKASDSSGNAVNTLTTPTVSTSDATVVTGGTCVLDDGQSPTYSSGAGVGYYNCNFTTAANAVSGAKATLTIKVLNPADATGTTYLTTTVPVSVGGTVAKTVLTTDSNSYAPGAQMLATFTATDAAGNPVYDGAASPGSVTANLATGGSAVFTGWYVGGVDASAVSLAKSKFYAPSIAGNLVLTATGTDAASTVLTANATVSGGVTDTAASAATDAANEATDAANAATDAANAAADAADAATSAAQDASAQAQAALAAVQALSAKITVLAAQIAKIIKKLKA